MTSNRLMILPERNYTLHDEVTSQALNNLEMTTNRYRIIITKHVILKLLPQLLIRLNKQ